MVNFLERVLQYPQYYRQFKCDNSLITAFNCPMEARLMKTRFAGLWTQYNYLFYVVDGRKVWHTAQGSYDLQKDNCVFVRKGAWVLEQFAETGFCVMLFFIPDQFICDVLSTRTKPLAGYEQRFKPVMRLEAGETLRNFFLSMSGYFSEANEPDSALLEIKFKELILMIADNGLNKELLSYFCSLLHEPQAALLKRVMEDNFCYNLGLETYAKLCSRSLSAFKRDFEKVYRCPPGRWLHERRLDHGMRLLSGRGMTVGEAAFESGFESPAHFSRAFKARFGKRPGEMKGAAAEVTPFATL